MTLYLSEKAPPHIPELGISNSPAGSILMARNILWPLEVQNTAPRSGPPCSIWICHLQTSDPSLTASLRWPWANMRSRFISPRGYSHHKLRNKESELQKYKYKLSQDLTPRMPGAAHLRLLRSILAPQLDSKWVHPPFSLTTASYWTNEKNYMIQGTDKGRDDVSVFLILHTT